jgi:D-alanine-D-alanine ligase
VRYECPADLDEACIALVREKTVAIHHAMRCHGYSRVDWRLADDGEVFFLELNTNPGLSERGNFALSGITAGLSYQELIMSMSASALSGTDRGVPRQVAP